MAQVEGFRRNHERFHEALHRELLDFHAGRRRAPNLVSIYADYSDLFCPDTIRELKSEIEAAPESFPSRRKSLERVHRFALEQFLDSRTAALDQEIAADELSRAFQWNGNQAPLAAIPALLAGEPNLARRRELERVRVRQLQETGELRERRLEELRSAAAKLGHGSSLDALQAAVEFDYTALSASSELLLAATEPAYQERLADSFGMMPGMEARDASAADAGYWERYNEPAGVFRDDLLLPAFGETFSSMGLDPEPGAEPRYDLEPRGGKSPGFFCIPVRIPHEIHVLGSRSGGRPDFACLMHEGGHAHHFAWTAPSVSPEFRLTGDRGLCECFGFVFEHLVLNEGWLIEHVGLPRPQAYLRFQALLRCYAVRREVGRLRFLLSVYGAEGTREAGERYAEMMREHTGLWHDPGMWLAEAADGLRCADYLRGWMLSAMLTDHLRLRFGSGWYRGRAAGNLLKEIWETGQLYSADELARELGLGKLEPQVLADDLQRGLAL